MFYPSARVIEDSISPAGRRLTTIEAKGHRSILAELNTHRTWSRNSASSRAIPVERTLARFDDDPALPLLWTSEQPGMSGGGELEGVDLDDAQLLFQAVHDHTAEQIRLYLERHPDKATRLHKSHINRLMEWGQQHTVVVTATAWENFFAQRIHPAAQPEIQALATVIKAAMDASTPRVLGRSMWHLPYIDQQTLLEALDREQELKIPGVLACRRIAVARCARTSYETQDGVRDITEDLKLYDRLVTQDPMHASPLEHVATPADWNEHVVKAEMVREWPHLDETITLELTLPRVGNLLGWQQHRLQVEAERQLVSFR